MLAGLGLLILAGLVGWYASSVTDNNVDQAVETGRVTTEFSDTTVAQELSPTVATDSLPAANEPGLVALELALTDPYTGTGSTGMVQLYMNSITGEICHRFDAPAITGTYRAYVHRAPFPQEGPVVVDLGNVANLASVCVMSNPIDLARTLSDGDDYYIAAHGDERSFIMRGQISSASVVFDNRDAALVAEQEAAANTDTTVGDGTADDLFGAPDEGAYLVVEAGQIRFEGTVPDEATANLLRAAFIPLLGRGIEVADNLQVELGAPPPSGTVIVAGSLLFDTGQDRIDGEAPVLDTVADLMAVNPTWTMTITGHTDNIGNSVSNRGLSLRRANGVRDRLIEAGIGGERLQVQGAGPDQPIGDNTTEEGRAQNRRIEISIDS